MHLLLCFANFKLVLYLLLDRADNAWDQHYHEQVAHKQHLPRKHLRCVKSCLNVRAFLILHFVLILLESFSMVDLKKQEFLENFNTGGKDLFNNFNKVNEFSK